MYLEDIFTKYNKIKLPLQEKSVKILIKEMKLHFLIENFWISEIEQNYFNSFLTLHKYLIKKIFKIDEKLFLET